MSSIIFYRFHVEKVWTYWIKWNMASKSISSASFFFFLVWLLKYVALIIFLLDGAAQGVLGCFLYLSFPPWEKGSNFCFPKTQSEGLPSSPSHYCAMSGEGLLNYYIQDRRNIDICDKALYSWLCFGIQSTVIIKCYISTYCGFCSLFFFKYRGILINHTLQEQNVW